MKIDQLPKWIDRLPGWLAKLIESIFFKIPSVKKQIDAEVEKMLLGLEPGMKPYRGKTREFTTLPDQGIAKDEILKMIRDFADHERAKWKDGFVSGGVYHGDEEHITFLNEVYALESQSNPLHADLFPSVVKFENEIIEMVAGFLSADNASKSRSERICGMLTSGGTESILVAMKAYRDRAREENGIRHPEMITSVTAHTAFEKAANYFGIKHVKIPIKDDYTMDTLTAERAVNHNTIVIVGSAPHFPHGIIDPIEKLAKIARNKQIGLHVDGCLGGFVLPFAQELSKTEFPHVKVPTFDFAIPEVTSLSIDTHKYGFAAKGSSVILYRGENLRSYQYFTSTDWPGGLYFSPTLTGSRPGALIATAWAAMLKTGRSGYLDSTRKILTAAKKIADGIRSIPDLQLIGDPVHVIAFTSSSLDIYRVLDEMSTRGWSLNGLHKPPAVHIALTLRHAQPGVAERFIADLKVSVEKTRGSKPADGGLAPVYGLAASIPFRGLVSDLLKKYLDTLYRP